MEKYEGCRYDSPAPLQYQYYATMSYLAGFEEFTIRKNSEALMEGLEKE